MDQKRTAVFPGSFDPFTKGHEAIVQKALPLFDEIIIAIGRNSDKKYFFTLEERINHIKAVFGDQPKIKVVSFEGLTVNFCKENNSNFIVRGLRDVKDFEYEKSIAIMNNKVEESVETIFFMTNTEFLAINSVIVRDILRNNGDVSQFLPKKLNAFLASE
ncbi:MAG: pantetheine-phosphate adenylyltransferase [Flavobacteriales bacterium]|jgi:pantetheine-phosphate adenylyltransferase|tara:strand:- start:1513 stop:1992 length:480 start_codon:yes stop_codon:yes gene_type:complete